jgi:hypothetical protein
MVKLGVVSSILHQKTGLSAYNLANIAGHAPTTFFLLRKVLRQAVKPEAILVDFEPSLLHADPCEETHSISEVAELRDCIELAWTTRDTDLFGRLVRDRFLLSARSHREIRAWLMEALGGQRGKLRDSMLMLWRTWNANCGSLVVTRAPAAPSPSLEPKHLEVPWVPNATNQAYLWRFLELAARHKIPTFLLVPPFHPRMHEERVRLGLDAAHTRFLEAVRARFPEVTIIDGRETGYDETFFLDSVHLERHGASAFTEDVAAILEERLRTPQGPSAWARLPTYSRTPSTTPLEDVAESAAVLSRRGASSQRK